MTGVLCRVRAPQPKLTKLGSRRNRRKRDIIKMWRLVPPTSPVLWIIVRKLAVLPIILKDPNPTIYPKCYSDGFRLIVERSRAFPSRRTNSPVAPTCAVERNSAIAEKWLLPVSASRQGTVYR